jgi:hypothetical protein
MEVLVMQVFVSLLLVAGSLVLLAYSVKQADHEHADRLSLLPIEPDVWVRPATEPGDQPTQPADPAPQAARAGTAPNPDPNPETE